MINRRQLHILNPVKSTFCLSINIVIYNEFCLAIDAQFLMCPTRTSSHFSDEATIRNTRNTFTVVSVKQISY